MILLSTNYTSRNEGSCLWLCLLIELDEIQMGYKWGVSARKIVLLVSSNNYYYQGSRRSP